MIMICDEFEAYSCRRVGAELRHRGIVVNSKKIRRLMRFVATTDSDHDGPIFRNLARGRIVNEPNQVCVADITYVAIAGFVYKAAILDAQSRRVVGYAINPLNCDARMAVAALKATILARQPAKAALTTRIAARPMPLRSTAASRWCDGAARESLRQCES